MTQQTAEHWIEIAPGIRRRTLVAAEQMMQVIVQLDGGSHLPEHHHVHEQITHVLKGHLRLIVDGVPHELAPGDSFALPGDTPHAADAHEDTLVIDTFSPPREDFLAQDAKSQ